jgi:hypothetical protein
LRVKQRSHDLAGIVQAVMTRDNGGAGALAGPTLAEITDEDIDALFG